MGPELGVTGTSYLAAESFRQVLLKGPYTRIDQLINIVWRDSPQLIDLLIQNTCLDSHGHLELPPFFIENGETPVYGIYSFWIMVSLSNEKGLWFYNLESLCLEGKPREEDFKIPPGIDQCPSLVSLAVRNAGLTSIPDDILDMIKLKNLDLSSNQISCIPSGIGRLRQLVYFNAADNVINKLPPQMSRLRKLQILILSGNRIDNMGFSLDSLSSLKVLNLIGNCLEEIPSGLDSLNQIEQVQLAYNDLSAEDEATWEEGDFSNIPCYQWHFSF